MAAVTQADIDALEKTVRSGVLTVRFAGPPAREITYQSMEVMVKELARMRAEFATANGTRQSFRLAGFKKGF